GRVLSYPPVYCVLAAGSPRPSRPEAARRPAVPRGGAAAQSAGRSAGPAGSGAVLLPPARKRAFRVSRSLDRQAARLIRDTAGSTSGPPEKPCAAAFPQQRGAGHPASRGLDGGTPPIRTGPRTPASAGYRPQHPYSGLPLAEIWSSVIAVCSVLHRNRVQLG